jgi:hypothetical protein
LAQAAGSTDEVSLGEIRRDPKVNPATAQNRRDEHLNREIARLSRQLARAKAIIDVQKNYAPCSDFRGPRNRS